MNDLSVILRCDGKEIYDYINSLESLLETFNYQLIIISNSLNSLNIKYEYMLYNYTECYSNFKKFCFSLCKYDKVLILESGMQINKSLINSIKLSIMQENKVNFQCDFKKYINKDSFFMERDTLIYNTKSDQYVQLNISLDDYCLLSFDNDSIEASVYKLIRTKRYKELYQWVESFSDNIKMNIYVHLEKEKLKLGLKEVQSIEEEFLKQDEKNKYTKYLEIKNLYIDYNENLKDKIIHRLIESKFSSEDLYFSFFILEVFNKEKIVLDILKLLDKDTRIIYLKSLFELEESFYLEIFNFMMNIDLIKEINIADNTNIEVYFDIIKTYVNCMASKSVSIDQKQKLIQIFTDYTHCGLYLLEKNMIQGEEAEFLMEIHKASSKLGCDINEGIKILKSASEKFELMTLATRYYIQKLVCENNLYASKLSICMIVKNEGSNIERCLKSLKPLVDNGIAEIILVDTGSTDSTVEIARKYVKNIYFHPWTGSFSEARNWSLSLATGEYIFIVDGDDEIKCEDMNKIIKEFSNDKYKKYNTFSVKVKSYFTEEKDGYSTITQNHIFKNDGYFHYSGAVHNQPIWRGPIKHLDVSIMHYGYIMTPEVSEKKFNRTVPLLKKELERNFNDIYKSIYYRYQLASSYNMHKDYKEALNEVNIYIKTVKDNWNNIKDNYNMTYNTLAVIIYMNNELYDEALDLCNESLKLCEEFIDFIYYKGKILFIKKMYKESIECMEEYLNVLNKFSSLSIAQDDKYVFYTLNLDKEVILRMINAYYQLKNYKACLEYINKIDDEKVLQQIIYIVFECYFKGKEYKKIIKLYETQITPESYNIFNYFIKKNINDLPKEEQTKFINAIINSDMDSKYINILDTSAMDIVKNDFHKVLHILDKYEIENIDSSGAKAILELVVPIAKEYNYLKYNDLIELKTFKRCIKFILNRTLNLKQFNMFTNEELLEVLDKYINTCVTLINLDEKELLEEREYKFCDFILKAFEELSKNDLISTVRYIKDAVNEDKEMARPMQLFLERILPKDKISSKVTERGEHNDMNNTMEEYSRKIKKSIEELINQNSIVEVTKLIEEYEKIIPNDLEICSMKAITFIMKNNLNAAKDVLLDGLKADKNNFDLLYNLAYVYENLNDYNNCVRAYIKAKNNCKNESISNEIENKINKIKSDYKGIIKKRIIFFVKPGMDSFLDDIINGLSKEYETKKIIVTNYNQIDEGMEWADICWFEWCDELIAYASNHKLANERKIICRIHSYEAFTNYPLNVNWENVNDVIFISNSIKDVVCSKVKIKEKKIDIIANGINTDKYVFKNRSKGFNIAYVGYINYKKGPMLLLHTFKAIYDKDTRYKLYIAGQFQDERDILYFEQMIKELRLEKNVFYQGWQQDLNSWLEDKNYILCTSVLESQNISVMQAMSKGIKPIIHNFVGAKSIYNSEYIWNIIEEAIEMITDKEYNSNEYREFIKEKYSLDIQMGKIKRNIEELNKSEDDNEITLNYIHSRLNKFIGYNEHNFNNYDFESAKVIIGRKEIINDYYELIEFIITNKDNGKLVINNVWNDKKNNKLIIPHQMEKSKNIEFIINLINEVMKYEVKFNNGIAGFVFDKDIIEDIKTNLNVYNWERAIPASQFMPMLGYLKIAERYIFAGDFINKNDRVLEAPCGFGYGAAYFSSLCSHVEALDIADDNINFAEETYSMNNISWVKGNVTNLKYKDDEFDVYVSYEVFEHLSLDMVEKYLQEAYRVIKTGGKFIISTPNREMRRHINNPFHIKEYSFVEFSRLIEKYFNRIEYYSVSNYKVEKGMKDTAVNMIAVCMK